jgi:hypothetical protein
MEKAGGFRARKIFIQFQDLNDQLLGKKKTGFGEEK